MECKIIKVNANNGVSEWCREETQLDVSGIKEDFKIFDTFISNEKGVKVYKNSENVLYFQYAYFTMFDQSGSRFVPINVINERIRTCEKYRTRELFKLNTNNPNDNYLVTESTLLKLVGHNHHIIPEPRVAHGYRIYNN